MDASCRGLGELTRHMCIPHAISEGRGSSLALYTYPPIKSGEYYAPPRGNVSGDMTCDCNTVMYRCEIPPSPGSMFLYQFTSHFLASTWHAFHVREEPPTRKILHGHILALLSDGFVKMGGVDGGLSDCLCSIVSSSLVPPTFCVADDL